jgi:hypothetical protein
MAFYASEILKAHRGDGTALTAAASASLFQGTTGSNAICTLPPDFFYLNRVIRTVTTGRISCVVTTPGTARFALQFGGSISVFDSLAINLNIVAKTNVHWTLELSLICASLGSGTAATLFPLDCRFTSEAVVGSPLPTAGGSGVLLLPYNTAPAVGAGFDSTAAQKVDLIFTQTVATGSVTMHTHTVYAPN